MMDSIDQYNKKKDLLVKELLEKIKDKGVIELGKKTSNLFRKRQENSKKIHVTEFNKVISIDTINQVAEVEGMTTYEDFVNETLKYGLLPSVVPELKLITIGGAVSGVGIESSSFRYGLVHETILEMEVLLSDGEVVTCSKNQNKDLFYGIPNSYGTLGYILKLSVKLVPAKNFVEITHIKYDDVNKYFSDVKKFCLESKGHDFVEGVIFNENEMYISLGRFVDEAPFVSNYKYMNIYFKSIEKQQKDYLATLDYIWRWDTDWFWGSKHFLMQNMALRFLFGKFILGSKSFWKLKRSYERCFGDKSKNEESIEQDVAIPIENCVEFLNFFHKEIGIKPIWICPIYPYDKQARFTLFNLNPDKLYVDIGFWDSVSSDKEEGFYNKKIEKKVEELKGVKSLYSTSYYSPEKFWELYNGAEYKKLKQKYDLNYSFRDIYQKCVLRK